MTEPDTDSKTPTVSEPQRRLLTDAEGGLWDFGSPFILAVRPVRGNPGVCDLLITGLNTGGSLVHVSIAFAQASAAFGARL